MKKQILIGLGVSGLLIVILAGVKFMQISAAMAEGANRPTPPETVTSFVAEQQSWPVTYSAIGSIDAVSGALLSAEEHGKISAVHFESGAEVTKGQLLVEIDAEVEIAQLNGVAAQLELAKLTANRQRALRKRGANSQFDLDQAESNLRNLKAEVEELKALVNRKRIFAPIAGKTGIRQVNVGQTVSQGDAIVTINSYDQFFVNFSLPQSAAGELAPGAKVLVKVDAYPSGLLEAKLNAIESQVDSLTRTIGLQATLTDARGKVRPGMFGTVEVFLNRKDDVIAIPESSVQFAPYGNSVWVIDSKAPAEAPRAAKPQTVKLGRRFGDQIAVVAGLEAGQEVVSSGIFKMRPGINVVVNNSVMPGSELRPVPEDT